MAGCAMIVSTCSSTSITVHFLPAFASSARHGAAVAIVASSAKRAGGLRTCHQKMCSQLWCCVVQKRIHDIINKSVPSGVFWYCSLASTLHKQQQVVTNVQPAHWCYKVQKLIHDVISNTMNTKMIVRASRSQR